jgi:glycosyltransferase involved in cell wall biosynthesis
MNVLYFHQHFSTPTGSTGIRSYAMAQKLLEQGHNVTMVCGSYGGGHTGLESEFKYGRREGNVHGIHVIEFNLAYSNQDSFLKRTGLFLLFALRSVGIALARRYDVLFATTTPLTAGIPGIAARWLRGKPFVFEVRDLWPELPREMGVITNPVILKLMAVLEWASYRSAHRLIGLSPGIVEGIARLGVKRENIAMIPNGCDLDIFSDKSQVWRPEGVKPSDLMAIFTGTHGIANGLDAVLDAAGVLKQRGRDDIKIVLIGQGKLKPTLQEHAKREGLDNVIFHDAVNKTKLAGLLSNTDIGLQILANVPAFYYGTSPNKFFDYIAAALPVLNNYPGWLAETIRENQCGFIVPPQNPDAFADALESAADDREQLVIMGKNAHELAETTFDREGLSVQFVQWLEGAKQ